MKLTEKQATMKMRREYRVLMVTHLPEGKAFALDNGIGVGKRAAEKMTAQADLFAQTCPSAKPGTLVPNDDGLFPGMTQTWRAL